MSALAVLKTRDLEPAVSAAWRAVDKLSLADRGELAPHLPALIEVREKIEIAIREATNGNQ